DVVEIETDAALARGSAAAADAADLKVRRRVAGTARALDVEIRCDRSEVEHVVDAAQLERFAFEAHDRNRRVLQIQLAPFGGDDDLFELLRLRRAAEQARYGERQRAQWIDRFATVLHRFPL